MADLMDKVVVITGASAGIGAATAKEFAIQGSKVVLVARRERELKDVADTCADTGLAREKILVIVADVTKEEDVKRIIQTTSDTFITIDVLVNNVGGGPAASFADSSLALFDQNIALNLRSVFMMCKEALPYLVQSKGSIVNLSSAASIRPFPLSVVYSAAKAGLDHLSRNMAKELGPKGVRVNIVSPACINTDSAITCGVVSSQEQKDKLLEDFAVSIPMRRVGIPEEVAKMIVFIASGAASYVTGAMVVVDGGFQLA